VKVGWPVSNNVGLRHAFLTLTGTLESIDSLYYQRVKKLSASFSQLAANDTLLLRQYNNQFIITIL